MIGNATELSYIFKCEQQLLNWNRFCLILGSGSGIMISE